MTRVCVDFSHTHMGDQLGLQNLTGFQVAFNKPIGQQVVITTCIYLNGLWPLSGLDSRVTVFVHWAYPILDQPYTLPQAA